MPKAARKRSSGHTKSTAQPTKLTLNDVSSLKRAAAKGSTEPLYPTKTTEEESQEATGKTPQTSDKPHQSKTSDSLTKVNQGNDAALSRGQRKRMAKREKYMKRERMVMASLKLKKQDEQAKRIDGLDALKEALLETICDSEPKVVGEKARPTTLVRSNRGKRAIVHKEVEHMKLVQEHPAFKANPLAAIHEHIKNTTAQLSDEEPKPVPVKAKPKKKKTRFRAARMKNR